MLAWVFPVVPACPSSSANVLICCLVQPDGLLPPHWRKMGESGEEGGEEVTCRDLPSLKIPLKLRTPHSAPPFPVSPSSIRLSQDKRANFYKAMTGSGTQTLPRSSVSTSLLHSLSAQLFTSFFLPITRSNPSRA